MTVGFGPVDGWFLTGPNSKMERVAAGNKSCLEQNAVIFLWQDVGKEPRFFDWAMHFFFVSLMVTVGFGPVDGWFLTGPNSKMERVAAGNKSCLEQNAVFFVARCWERVQFF